MSLEYMQSDQKYPKAYHVRPNYCRCHPETCCCDPLAVFTPDGKKYSTHFRKDEADAVVKELNEKGTK